MTIIKRPGSVKVFDAKAASREIRNSELSYPHSIAARGSTVVWERFTVEDGDQFFGASNMCLSRTEDGLLYFCDYTGVVRCMEISSGDIVRHFHIPPGTEDYQYRYTVGIDIDDEDNLYIADRGDDYGTDSKIIITDKYGTFIKAIRCPDPSYQLYMQLTDKSINGILQSVAIANNGKMFITDNNMCRLLVYYPNGNLLGEVCGPGIDVGRLLYPGNVDVAPDGYVHICNGLNRRIEVYDEDGNFIRLYGLSQSFIGSFVAPSGLCFNSDGDSVVTDFAYGTIQFFDEVGNYMYHMAEEDLALEDVPQPQRTALQISYPGPIVYYPTDDIYIFSQGGDTKSIQARRMLPLA